jgi:dienelactone hydrolase
MRSGRDEERHDGARDLVDEVAQRLGVAGLRLLVPAVLAVSAVVAAACAGAAKKPGFKGGALMSASAERPARRDVTFRSQGADLSGWLYLPDTKPRWPLVIMAHGFSATRRMTTDRYAEVFRASGLAVLLYDHRGFGDSGGEPRLQINPWVQAREYRDAISHASDLGEVDAKRIGLWGDSFSGGVALAVAAVDPRVAALVIQVPALGSELPPEDADGSRRLLFEKTMFDGAVEPSGPDEVEGPLPVVSDDQARRPSALQPLTAYRWFMEYGSRPGSRWVNTVTRARPKTQAPWQPGLCAAALRCPTQFIVSPEDEMRGSAPAVSRAVYDRLPGKKEWIDIDGGHFGLLYFPSPAFERAASAQARFLSEHLR